MRISVIDLKSCAQFGSTFERGIDYLKKGYVSLVDYNAQRISANVRGNSGAYYSVDIALSKDASFGKLIIDKWNCTCPAHASYPDGYCKHVVATALAFNAVADSAPVGSADNQPGKAAFAFTDPVLRRMLMRSAAEPRINAQTRKARLFTVLEWHREYARLSFRVGYERAYVVKNLGQFIEMMRNGQEYIYGKSLTLLHSMSNFREEDRPMLQFIMDEYEASSGTSASWKYMSRSDSSRYIFLNPVQIDRFIAAWSSDTIAIAYKTEGKGEEHQVVRENFRIRTSISMESEGQYVLKLPENLKHIDGVRSSMVSHDGKVYFCDEQFCSDILPLVKAATKGRLMVSEEDMQLLSSVLLPKLEHSTRFTSEVDLSRYETPPLQAELYIEQSAGGLLLTARLEFVYGTKRYPAFGEERDGAAHAGDYIAEECARQVVSECFAGGELSENIFAIPYTEDFVFDFATLWRERLEQYMTIYCEDSLRTAVIRRPEKVSIGLHLDSDLLMMDISIGEEERSELAGILSSLSAKKRFFRMKDGTFLSLEGNSLSELSDIADSLGLSPEDIAADHIRLPAYRAMYLDAALKESHSLDYTRSQDFRKLIRDLRNVDDSDFELPETLKGVLRGYQTTGYRWMRTLAAHNLGGILADDMGLGKTIQVLAVLAANRGEGINIVVCPSSLVLNWVSEAAHFVPELNTVAILGPAPFRAEMIAEAAKNADLIVTSYDSLKRDIELYEDIEFLYIIADEAQYMKNHATQNAKAVKALNGKHRFALTGTPVENTLAELWSIFDFILPGYLFTYGQFRKRYEQPIIRDGDDSAAQSLRLHIAFFIMRRLKRDVLTELPEKTETLLEAVMEPEQQKVYMANAAMTRDKLLRQIAEGISGRIEILALLTKLRQICCDPALVYDNYSGGSAKLELCMELISQCVSGGHKLLLFSQFTSMLSVIEQRLTAAGIKYYILTGKTKPAERLGMVEAFNSDDTPVFLISLKAGGTGLNLTGADVVIHYDPWWNISAQNQATDRAHRIGQKKKLQIYKLILKGTIEERILALQQSKAELVDKIIEADGDALSSMSIDDLLELLS
ncbi:MAG: ATP-dependent helicase [Ruminococcaceae bacterium]|nr:ATP-dependent helicase [Oscillospiraceae bacterium]